MEYGWRKKFGWPKPDKDNLKARVYGLCKRYDIAVQLKPTGSDGSPRKKEEKPKVIGKGSTLPPLASLRDSL